MFKVLIPGVIGIVLVLQFRYFKETKNYRIIERKESLYIDTNGIASEYINSNQIINKYEY